LRNWASGRPKWAVARLGAIYLNRCNAPNLACLRGGNRKPEEQEDNRPGACDGRQVGQELQQGAAGDFGSH
jgi:hypothetical protein